MEARWIIVPGPRVQMGRPRLTNTFCTRSKHLPRAPPDGDLLPGPSRKFRAILHLHLTFFRTHTGRPGAPLFSPHTLGVLAPFQYSVIAPFLSAHILMRLGMDATMFPSSSDLLAFSQCTAFRTRRRNDFSPSHPPGCVAASRRSSNAHAFSMGLRSGE